MTAAHICGWFVALASFSGAFVGLIAITAGLEVVDRLARRRAKKREVRDG